jgi:hypothetical protein
MCKTQHQKGAQHFCHFHLHQKVKCQNDKANHFLALLGGLLTSTFQSGQMRCYSMLSSVKLGQHCVTKILLCQGVQCQQDAAATTRTETMSSSHHQCQQYEASMDNIENSNDEIDNICPLRNAVL